MDLDGGEGATVRRAGAVLAVATLVACGGGGSKSSSSSCIDRVVDLLNSLDVSRIDAADGLNDSERSDLEGQLTAKTKDQPDLASGGACTTAFDALPESQQSDVFKRIRPEVAAALGASARSTFSTVASSIN
jgi:hypothetical protein